MKKLWISIISVLTVFVLLFSGFIVSIVNITAYDSRITRDEESGTLDFSSDEIKILHLSDVQTSNIIECAMAYPTVEYLVREVEPDLIVLTGDNTSNGSGRLVLRTFISFMDSFEIPWAPVYGNHDRNTDLTMEELSAAYEQSEYCLFKTGSLTDRYGNYYYNLTHEGEAVYSLFFMDSANSYFTEEQVRWYEDSVNEIAKDAGKTVPGFTFFHIPIEETAAAHEQYKNDPATGSGTQVSDVRTQSKNTGFFDTLKRLGSTTALFYGHDHRNNTQIYYRDVLFCYAMKTGKTVYYERGSIGGNLITVRADATFTVERIYSPY